MLRSERLGLSSTLTSVFLLISVFVVGPQQAQPQMKGLNMSSSGFAGTNSLNTYSTGLLFLYDLSCLSTHSQVPLIVNVTKRKSPLSIFASRSL